MMNRAESGQIDHPGQQQKLVISLASRPARQLIAGWIIALQHLQGPPSAPVRQKRIRRCAKAKAWPQGLNSWDPSSLIAAVLDQWHQLCRPRFRWPFPVS